MIDTTQTTPAPASYVGKAVRLKFWLGEFCLFTARLRCLTSNLHFVDMPPDIETPADLMARLEADLDGVFYSSHPLRSALPRLSLADGTVRYIPNRYPRYCVDLTGGFAEYLRKFAAKPRHNLTRTVRKFAEASGGSIDFREYRSPSAMLAFHGFARAISAQTYQDKLLGVGLPDTDAFRQMLQAGAEDGTVRGYLLFQNDTPVAFAYCSIHGRAVTYQTIGYDPAFSRFSPGTVLLYHLLERLFAEGSFDQFDFGTGEAHYKSFFSTGSATCADIYFLRRTFRNAALVGLHAALATSSAFASRTLERLNLKRGLKKFFRQRAAERQK